MAGMVPQRRLADEGYHREKEAKFAAATEWYRRLWLPDEVARRHATMRRHLEDPVLGVEFFPDEDLPESVRQRIEQHEGDA